jgi:hypothetical protein
MRGCEAPTFMNNVVEDDVPDTLGPPKRKSLGKFAEVCAREDECTLCGLTTYLGGQRDTGCGKMLDGEDGFSDVETSDECQGTQGLRGFGPNVIKKGDVGGSQSKALGASAAIIQWMTSTRVLGRQGSLLSVRQWRKKLRVIVLASLSLRSVLERARVDRPRT